MHFLFAVPIAIMGAIYTAYFMAPGMRSWVKPGIEIMAALPTVILGFIGGLWLAPIVEDNLSSVLSIFVVLPVKLFLLAIVWSLLPDYLTKRFDGWYGHDRRTAHYFDGVRSFYLWPLV